MNNTVFIDIVICTYNNAELLDRTLKAIAQQKITSSINWSVLVVNNNSTDKTMAVVEEYIQSGLFPLKVVLEPIQGLTPARLCGVKHTTGDWIAFVDDDCLLAEDWIEQTAKFALENPNCGAFGGKVILDWQTPPPTFVLNYGWCFAEQDYGEVPKKIPGLVGAGLVINRTALTDTGWIDKPLLQDRVGKKLISGGDVELGLRIAAKYDLWYYPKCQLRHIIPAYRTSIDYLKKMNYGLGSSKLFGSSMLWSGSYLDWLVVSVLEGLKDSIKVSIQVLKVLMGKRSGVEVALSWSFIRGWWTGLYQLLQMNSKERQQLLGCARVANQC
jgi:glycosyltransferase involved in cell wall biosynthesis